MFTLTIVVLYEQYVVYVVYVVYVGEGEGVLYKYIYFYTGCYYKFRLLGGGGGDARACGSARIATYYRYYYYTLKGGPNYNSLISYLLSTYLRAL